uniref:Nonstructural protein n=1 Tax=Toxocara canis TaxID=6265 RepID=A0A183U8B4_TOXCA
LTIRSRLRRLGSWGRQRATCEGPTGSEALAPTLESRSTASRDGPPTASNGASPDDQSRQPTDSQD